MMIRFTSLVLTAIALSQLLVLVACDGSLRPRRQQQQRQLGLTEDWALSFVDGPVVTGNLLTLTFDHGANGTPQYKIYGSNSFQDLPVDQAVGTTCRSRGGAEQASTEGMTFFRTDETNRMILGIEIDPAAMEDTFISKSSLAADGGDAMFIQFCVYVALVNEATNEEVSFVETEIRYTVAQDGSIFVDNFSSTSAEPFFEDFVTKVGLVATVCKTPDAGQGDTVSICISTTDENELASLDVVESFEFQATDAAGNPVTQIAFEGGTPGSLTQMEVSDGTNLKFSSILKADFYRSSSISPTTVVGFGRCAMNTRRGRGLVNGNESDGTGTVSLSFVIGGEDQVLSDSNTEDSAQKQDISQDLVIMCMSLSLIVSLVSLLVVAWFVLAQKHAPKKEVAEALTWTTTMLPTATTQDLEVFAETNRITTAATPALEFFT